MFRDVVTGCDGRVELRGSRFLDQVLRLAYRVQGLDLGQHIRVRA